MGTRLSSLRDTENNIMQKDRLTDSFSALYVTKLLKLVFLNFVILRNLCCMFY